jgi:hypothetical protein
VKTVATQTTDIKARSLTPTLFRHILLWIPIIGGLVHQFMMWFSALTRGDVAQPEPLIGSKADCMYVFLDPPGYLQPTITLEYQWWTLLLLASALVCILAYLERIRTFPNRLVIPFYLYILFLLIFVKPVSHHGGELPARCGPDAAEPTPTSAIIWDDTPALEKSIVFLSGHRA